MKLIICLDDKNGMMFNKRRQSKDIAVAEKVKEIIGNNLLHIHSYSSPIFPEATVCESFEKCSDLDKLGHCGVAYTCLGKELMPTENETPHPNQIDMDVALCLVL